MKTWLKFIIFVSILMLFVFFIGNLDVSAEDAQRLGARIGRVTVFLVGAGVGIYFIKNSKKKRHAPILKTD